MQFECDLRDFPGYALVEHIAMTSENLQARNSAQAQNVRPRREEPGSMEGGVYQGRLAKASWNVLRFAKEKK